MVRALRAPLEVAADSHTLPGKRPVIRAYGFSNSHEETRCMSAPSRPAPAHSAIDAEPAALDDLLLARIACAGGASRAQLVRDVGPLFSNRLSPAEWRGAVDTALARLDQSALVREHRGRLRASDDGAAKVARFLEEKEAHARAWSEQRDIWLVAKALGLDAGKPGVRKALVRPEGLSALIVQKAFGLAMRQALSPSKLRAALALVALEQAFGDNVKSGLRTDKGSALSAKAGRVLAGQLLQSPREITTDGRLVAALSAEQVGAARAEMEVLRLALLRRLAGPAPVEAAPKPNGAAAAKDAATPVSAKTPQRPGLTQFSAGVLSAARGHAEGWPGSRKAFISQVWKAIRTSHPEWGLSEIEFKDMLAGAHRAGQLVLTGADLKNKQNIKDLEDSAILYKNTVWHYVRVED
jgi:hypothetical protein